MAYSSESFVRDADDIGGPSNIRSALKGTGEVGLTLRKLARDEVGSVGEAVNELRIELSNYSSYVQIADPGQAAENLRNLPGLRYMNIATLAATIIFIMAAGVFVGGYNYENIARGFQDNTFQNSYTLLQNSIVRQLIKVDPKIQKTMKKPETIVKFKTTYLRYINSIYYYMVSLTPPGQPIRFMYPFS